VGSKVLKKNQEKLYDSFYESTHHNEYLDTKTDILVGLSAAMSMDCYPCMKYYLKLAAKHKIKKGEVSEVLAKVMAVAAGQKKLQMQEVAEKYGIDIDSYE
jgi:alkylhydroperoxidase/carboxymuconolactone decarboxylase family protein YurZ